MEQKLDMRGVGTREIHAVIREKSYAGPTGGLAAGFVPYRAEEIPPIVGASERYPAMHGTPGHVGNPATLGISDLDEPEFGQPVKIYEDQLPVLWPAA